MNKISGVTLIELLVAMTILAVLASVVVPLGQVSVRRGKEIELKRNLRIIRNALDGYKEAWDQGRMEKKVGESGYPRSLQILVEGVNDVKSPVPGRKIKLLRRIPGDPLNPDKSLAPEATWGIRSYDSEPDSPREGNDVYDVYSKSEGTGLDGTPYKSW